MTSKNSRIQGLDDGEVRTAPSREVLDHRNMSVKPRSDLETTKDYSSIDRDQNWKAKQQSMLEGVVNLTNTVDKDRDTTWAPGKQSPLWLSE